MKSESRLLQCENPRAKCRSLSVKRESESLSTKCESPITFKCFQSCLPLLRPQAQRLNPPEQPPPTPGFRFRYFAKPKERQLRRRQLKGHHRSKRALENSRTPARGNARSPSPAVGKTRLLTPACGKEFFVPLWCTALARCLAPSLIEDLSFIAH